MMDSSGDRVRGILPGMLAALLLTAVTASASEEMLPIVAEAIEFHGGELYESSMTKLEICSKSGCFGVESKVEGGLFRHEVVDLRPDRDRRVRITNDEVRMWEGGEEVPVPVGEEQRWRDWVMARVYFAFLPYRLGDPSVRFDDRGMETWDGRELHRVEVSFEPGSSSAADDEYVYWFDPGTGRLEQFAYSFSGNPGGLRFRPGFNYRRVGGILFFDQENLGVEGPDLAVESIDPEFVAEEMSLVSTVTLREIEVDPLR